MTLSDSYKKKSVYESRDELPPLWGDVTAADFLQPHTIEPHYFEL